MRRLVEAVLAPGVVLAAPGREEALVAKLAQHGHVVAGQPSPEPKRAAPAELTRAEVAALLVASAHYRAVAPPDASPAPGDTLTERLRASLPPGMAAATDAAIEALLKREATAPGSANAQGQQPGPRPSMVDLLWRLREAIRRREAVTIRYQGASEPAPRTRTIRPLYLERHGGVWHLTAYCLLAGAERTFRLDRVLALDEAAAGEVRPHAQAPAPKRRGRGAPRRTAPRVGFFAGPPDPPPGSPLVSVWLSYDGPAVLVARPAASRPARDRGDPPTERSDEVVGRLGGDLAGPIDHDPLDGGRVGRVAAHAVGLAIDERAQLAVNCCERLRAEPALEDAALHA